MTTHKNVYIALSAAQAEMGPVVKGALNPHFRSKYADLADVMQVALPSLNKHGIAAWHSILSVEGSNMMRTTLSHGESDTHIECDVPLIVSKNDMQGMKSATTYAKRIGIESLTGIAPEDDDGNAAAEAAPKKSEAKKAAPKAPPETINDQQFIDLKSLIEEAGVTEDAVLERVGAPSLEEFPSDKYAATVKGLKTKIAKDQKADDSEIPY